MSQQTPNKTPAKTVREPQTVGDLLRLLSKTEDTQSRQALLNQVLRTQSSDQTTH